METQQSESRYTNTTIGSQTAMSQSQPKGEHAEGQVASRIEEQTAKLPSDTFLWAAVGSMAISFLLQMSGRQRSSLFVGQWAPTFLILGLYNKLVKVAGSH
jgi:hypothetical protein